MNQRGGSRSEKAIYYMHEANLFKKLVHSTGSVLWHRNSAQGSFEAGCNTKTHCGEFRNAPLSVCIHLKWSLPGISLHVILDCGSYKADQHGFVIDDDYVSVDVVLIKNIKQL